MKVLYISGPFSHPDPVHGISRNILQASEVALLAVLRWTDLLSLLRHDHRWQNLAEGLIGGEAA